jgi:hypothetical protein
MTGGPFSIQCNTSSSEYDSHAEIMIYPLLSESYDGRTLSDQTGLPKHEVAAELDRLMQLFAMVTLDLQPWVAFERQTHECGNGYYEPDEDVPRFVGSGDLQCGIEATLLDAGFDEFGILLAVPLGKEREWLDRIKDSIARCANPTKGYV